MKLSDEDLKLVNESIEHWKRDIEAPLLAEDEILENDEGELAWLSSGEQLLIGHEDCPLCKEYLYISQCLYECPLLINGMQCGIVRNNPYDNFMHNPCLETCQAMIKALESLKND